MSSGLERQRGPESKKEEYIIVEVGSGGLPYIDSPRVSAGYAQRFRDDASIYFIATDHSGGALAAGRDSFKAHSVNQLDKTGRVHFVIASGSYLPFRDASVSEVILRNVLGDQETKEPLEMMREVERVLKVGGILKVIEMYTPQVARLKMDYLSRVKTLERLPDAEKTGFMDETETDRAMLRNSPTGFVARFRKKELAS